MSSFKAFLTFLLIFAALIPNGPSDPSATETILSKISSTMESEGILIRDGSLVSDDMAISIPVLVHVREESRGEMRKDFEDLGFEVGYRFSHVDVYEMEGPLYIVDDLSRMEEVTYIEMDVLGTFDMDVSSGVVKAPQVWSSLISRGGNLGNGVTGEGIGIAVVDSGIDAGHPDLDWGTKTVRNIKAVRAGDPWVEMENTDTSVGHGSHCAGIAAGNGDASAGSRRGVAPSANLIGLSLTEGDEEISTSNYLYGLEWVFENSRPYSNPFNIRVCTNSWHTTVGEYEPEMALSKIINRLTYENNVVCTFSAGNDGRLDPEGTEIWTSQQGNVPGAIMVAAYARDGSYVADFTSHGQVGLNHTYADVGAPGVRIWSSHARRTGISAGSKIGGNPNPYYLAISGTSMSTPHVAGAVALLFEACPSLKVSGWSEDYNGTDPEWFYSHENRFVHEAELILEASATPLPYEEGAGSTTGIFVEDSSTGWGGKHIDYVQGYGMIDVEKAVGIALTLSELRGRYRERNIDVFTALKVYKDCMTMNITRTTETLVSSWEGEYSRFNDQNGKPLIVQNQTKFLYIPEGTRNLQLTLEFDQISLSRRYVGGITIDVDTDLDGDPNIGGGIPLITRPGTYDIPISGTDVYYGVTVRGQGLKLIIPSMETSYVELRIPYTIRAEIKVGEGSTEVNRRVYSSAMNAFPFSGSDGGSENSTLNVRVYDIDSIGDPFSESEEITENNRQSWWWVILIVVIGILSIGAYMFLKRRRNPEDK
jgi:serine protease AprX